MYKITLLLLLIPSILFATIDELRHEKTKKINKEFSVSKNANLQLLNKYGNVSITSWNENKIAIEVVITVKDNDLDRVENRIANILVEFKASSDKVFAKTIIESGEKNLALEIICHVLNGLNSDSPSPALDIVSNVSSALIFCHMMSVHCPHTNEYRVLKFSVRKESGCR